MLTPDKIKEKQFQSAGRGTYRADDVDAFMNEVTVSYEQMFKENGDLIRKISILAKKVEEYRADEESLKLALLNAQKLADQIVSEAKEKAQNENAAASAEAEKTISEAKAQAEELTVNSKRESAAIVESAKAEAERIIADANKKADEILGNINRKVTHETLVFDMTKKEASEFKSKLVAMYKEHINLINQLPEIADEQIDAEEDTEEIPEETAVAEEVEETQAVEAVEAIEETQEIAEPVTEEPAVTESEQVVEEEPEAHEEVSAPAFEDVYSDSAEREETPTETAPEPVKDNAFKLDLSKIDFSDDGDDDGEPEAVAEPAPAARTFDKFDEDDPEEDDDTGSISFKNFFRKR